MSFDVMDYFRQETLPHIWCPGCGNGIILRDFAVALERLNYPRDEVVIVSGIGCSSRAAGYLNFDTVHTTHGRALPFATGIKMANPNLKVFVIMGDGDSSAIGGNHLIHAARRNIDLTAIIFNNNIYGMTGGQFSPLTPRDKKATTAPYGMIEQSFDICRLAEGAGATYVGRATTYHNQLLTQLIMEGAQNPGFSLIEAVTHCPTSYGRRNGMASPSDMVRWQKDNAVWVDKVRAGKAEVKDGQFTIGVLHRHDAPEFTAAYMEVVKRARGQE
ncbi:MAG: 2-oxoacid:ferredoxin oxidoreductase subunit beta [Desulfitobacteriaceae bacterium]